MKQDFKFGVKESVGALFLHILNQLFLFAGPSPDSPVFAFACHIKAWRGCRCPLFEQFANADVHLSARSRQTGSKTANFLVIMRVFPLESDETRMK
jgi:hypothetical protein